MTPTELDEQFGIPGVLAFDATPSGLTFARITGPAADATIYLQGAHIAEWTPAGEQPVIFLSPRTDLAPGKPIRGGIPVIFPWFGPRSGQPAPPHSEQPGPSHGFARTTEWQLAFAAVSGQEVHLTLTLGPSDATRALGFDHFGLAMRVVVGPTLAVELTVANQSASGAALVFEEALHTYFQIADATRVTVAGLAGISYIDKRDEFRHKVQPEGALVITRDTDRVFLDTDSTCVIDDQAGARHIVVRKAGSHTTVVWNPWSTLTPGLPDMEPEGWRTMICVETANADRNAITLPPGETHTMSAAISVERAAAGS